VEEELVNEVSAEEDELEVGAIKSIGSKVPHV